MDYTFDSWEDTNDSIEEIERMKRRKERAARMRREKQLQMRRRRRAKILLIQSLGILGAVIIFALAVTIVKRGTKGQENADSKDVFVESITETQDGMAVQPEPVKKMLAVKSEDGYKFNSSSDTMTIYSDEVISSNAVLIDESTDMVVASKSAKERISPASMTKVLTLLVAAEHISEEELEHKFTMTREITDYGYINDCSSVGFLEGEHVTIRDLFYGTILPSGCDAAVGLATYVAGSHEAFVEMMNEKLKELGISGTSHMTNCVGIYDKEHYSTVYDMAVIMKAAVQSEFCKEILSEHRYVTEATTEHPEGIDISNWFLRRIEDKDTGGEVLCAKTGYVMQSKNCAVSYGVFADGKPYICVTAGSSSSWRCIYDHVEIYNKYIEA